MSLTDSDIDIVRTAWEHGFSYVATKINVALRSREVQIDVAPPPEDIYRLEVAIQRLCNALILVRPYSLDLPRDAELGPWPIGFINGQNNSPHLAWRDCATDEELDDILEFVVAREWSKAVFRENIVDAAKFYSSTWRTFFDRMQSEKDQIRLPDDPITLQQMADIAMTDAKTVRNWGISDRPKPVVPGKGKHPALFSYYALRAWFIAKRPDASTYLPLDYKSVRATLSKMSK